MATKKEITIEVLKAKYQTKVNIYKKTGDSSSVIYDANVIEEALRLFMDDVEWLEWMGEESIDSMEDAKMGDLIEQSVRGFDGVPALRLVVNNV